MPSYYLSRSIDHVVLSIARDQQIHEFRRPFIGMQSNLPQDNPRIFYRHSAFDIQPCGNAHRHWMCTQTNFDRFCHFQSLQFPFLCLLSSHISSENIRARFGILYKINKPSVTILYHNATAVKGRGNYLHLCGCVSLYILNDSPQKPKAILKREYRNIPVVANGTILKFQPLGPARGTKPPCTGRRS